MFLSYPIVAAGVRRIWRLLGHLMACCPYYAEGRPPRLRTEPTPRYQHSSRNAAIADKLFKILYHRETIFSRMPVTPSNQEVQRYAAWASGTIENDVACISGQSQSEPLNQMSYARLLNMSKARPSKIVKPTVRNV